MLDMVLYLLMTISFLSIVFMLLVVSDAIELPFWKDEENKEKVEEFSTVPKECSKLHRQKTTV